MVHGGAETTVYLLVNMAGKKNQNEPPSGRSIQKANVPANVPEWSLKSSRWGKSNLALWNASQTLMPNLIDVLGHAESFLKRLVWFVVNTKMARHTQMISTLLEECVSAPESLHGKEINNYLCQTSSTFCPRQDDRNHERQCRFRSIHASFKRDCLVKHTLRICTRKKCIPSINDRI